MNLTYI